MKFSEFLIGYLRKHYATPSIRFTQILILVGVFISISALAYSLLNSVNFEAVFDDASITITILFLVLFIPAIIFAVFRVKNGTIDRLECAIILNEIHVNKMDMKTRKMVLILLNKYLGTKFGKKGTFGKYFPDIEMEPMPEKEFKIENRLLSMIDPKDILERKNASS